MYMCGTNEVFALLLSGLSHYLSSVVVEIALQSSRYVRAVLIPSSRTYLSNS
jgi:hypothetical protein